MTTLISVRYGSGEVRRCDANCYDAKSKKCDCVCGGRNHGAGLERAAANVREDMKHYVDTLGGRNAKVSVDVDVDVLKQGSLL